MHLLRSYFGLLVGVPGEGNGVVGNLLDVGDGVEALFVVSCGEQVGRVGRGGRRQGKVRVSQQLAGTRTS